MSFPALRYKLPFVSILLGATICCLPGCNSSDQPELGQVTGIITLDGTPLKGVSVLFQPAEGRPAQGSTNAEGRYELTYIGQTKGTKVGPNRVEIGFGEGDEESGEMEEPGDGEPQAASKNSKSAKPIVPARYNARSELNVEVKPGANTFDFELKSN